MKESCHAFYKLIIINVNYKPLKLSLRVFLGGHTVAMVTYYVSKLTSSCSPKIGQFFLIP